MTLQIELDAETEATLTRQACDKGVDLPTYACELLKAAQSSRTDPKPPPTVQEFRAMLDEFDKLGPKELPFDDQNWSREIIYGDHP